MEYALGLPLPRDFARFSVITSRERPQFVYRPCAIWSTRFPEKNSLTQVIVPQPLTHHDENHFAYKTKLPLKSGKSCITILVGGLK